MMRCRPPCRLFWEGYKQARCSFPQMSLQMQGQGARTLACRVLIPEVTEGKHWKGISADGKGFVQAAFVQGGSALPTL